jgi:hypothetical protein
MQSQLSGRATIPPDVSSRRLEVLPMISPAHALLTVFDAHGWPVLRSAKSPTSYPPACIVRSGNTTADEAFVPRRTGL